MAENTTWRQALLGVTGLGWIGFQIYVLFFPQMPLLERPLHLAFALAAFFLSQPIIPSGNRFKQWIRLCSDSFFGFGVLAIIAYYLSEGTRLTERMEGIDDVLFIDRAAGLIFLILILDSVRRLIGFTLLAVLLSFIGFAIVGQWIPAWTESPWVPELIRYDGMTLSEMFESFTMTANGILGITTSTSVGLVFYFVLFGAFYSAIGGGQLFIDFGLRLAGKQIGGAAKAAVVSSSLMGSISGSAVANVATTGVFTIPLMKRTGYPAPLAAGIESIASTGGQLMPPIMGIAAFVMAELLQVPYGTIVLAGIIPALAFYLSIFLIVDFSARKNGFSPMNMPQDKVKSLRSRWHLLLPPIILVAGLIWGWSAPLSALSATGVCIVTAYFRRTDWLSLKEWMKSVRAGVTQAASVAIPIAAIGIIIEVAIQSNLALKFAGDLISLSGGNTFAALLLVIIGCLVMGMGLPTVAAYIIGSILFVPTLIDLEVPELSAHMFVMYYCVLSMVTPPVALASYTASGLAQTNAFVTSLQAFRLSWVAFIIPLGFVFQPALIGQGTLIQICASIGVLVIAIIGWAATLEGYLFKRLSSAWRIAIGSLTTAIFATPIFVHSDLGRTTFPLSKPLWILWASLTGLLLVSLTLATLLPRARQLPK